MYEIVSPQSVGYLVHVHAAGGGIENLFVQSALLIHLGGCAVLHRVAGVEHIEGVRINNLPDIVADNYHRPPLLDSIDGGLNLLCGDGIKAGRRLVKEDDGGFFKNIRAIAILCCCPPLSCRALD